MQRARLTEHLSPHLCTSHPFSPSLSGALKPRPISPPPSPLVIHPLLPPSSPPQLPSLLRLIFLPLLPPPTTSFTLTLPSHFFFFSPSLKCLLLIHQAAAGVCSHSFLTVSKVCSRRRRRRRRCWEVASTPVG